MMANDNHFAFLTDGAASWNQWRLEEPQVDPDLNGISLTLGQKQWSACCGGPINLRRARLRDADLRHATLNHGNLEDADLTGANLSSARLQHANLRAANLSVVCFTDADLGEACFEGADLRGADLRGARSLEQSQIETALGDAATMLPAHIAPPKAWLGETGDLRHARRGESDVPRSTAPAAESEAAAAAPRPNGANMTVMPGVAAGCDVPPSTIPAAETLAVTAPRRHNAGNRPVMFGVAALTLLFCYETDLFPKLSDAAPRDGRASAQVVDRTLRDAEPQRLDIHDVKNEIPIQDVREATTLVPLAQLTSVSFVPVDGVHPLPGAEPIAVDQRGAQLAVQEFPSLQEVSSSAAARPIEPVRLGMLQPLPKTPSAGIPAAVAETAARSIIVTAEAPNRAIRPANALTGLSKTASAPQVATLPAPDSQSRKSAQSRAALFDFLSRSDKSQTWIEALIERYYLSGSALDQSSLQRIYSESVDYFGSKKLAVKEIARAQERYYQLWPERHYELIPGSIEVHWTSADVADVAFDYRFKVSAPHKHANSGRGRAQLSLDFKGRSPHIIREDGEVLAGNN